MHPVLLDLGKIKINSYGFMIAIGFLLGVLYLARRFKRAGLHPERAVDLGFWSLLVGLVGSRVLFVITRWSEYTERPLTMLYIWEGGLVFFGGLILAVAFVAFYIHRHKLPAWKVLDYMAGAVVLAHAFGRIGCFLAGCCHGLPTTAWCGVRFYSDLVEPSLQGVPVHPTQLYESISLFLLFGVIQVVESRKRFDGQSLSTYLMLYPIIRYCVEMFRGDAIRGFVLGGLLSTSQFISIFIFVLGVLVFAWCRRKRLPL